MRWDVLGIRGKLHQLFKFLIRQHTSPGALAFAVFVGIFIGVVPLYGLHLFLSIFAAMTLRLNKIVVYAAANISVPPLIPIILVASFQFGYTILHQEIPPFSRAVLHEIGWHSISYIFLGSLVLGLFLGTIGGGITYVTTILIERKRQHPEHRRLTESLFKAFRFKGIVYASFVRGKTRGDPVYKQVLGIVPPTYTTVDVGGGQGLLSLILAKHSSTQPKRIVYDWDARKVAAGKMAARNLGVDVEFYHQDVNALAGFPASDCILCVDVLHYHSIEEQQNLLKKMADAVKPGGMLLIRDMDLELGPRAWFTMVQEYGSLILTLTKAQKIIPRRQDEVVRDLTSLGFEVQSFPSSSGPLFGNILLLAKRSLT